MGREMIQTLRGLWRRPGIPLFAGAILALGVAGALAVGSVVSGVLLEALPYPEADRLVLVWRSTDEEPALRGALSPPDWLDLRERATAFEGVGAVNSFRTTYLPDAGDPEQVDLGVVTGEFFEVLGVAPWLGRGILPADDRPAGAGAPSVVVLDYGFWQRRFGGDPAAVGRSITFGGTEHTVIGVMPEGFELLMPDEADMTTDLQGWVPLALDYASQPRDGFYLKVLARLAPGVAIERAAADVEAVAAALRAGHAEHAEAGLRLRAVPLHDEVTAHVRPFLVILALVGGIVLVVTCANASALLLVRFLGRGGDTAVRLALGAERSRLVGSFLFESAAVTTVGTALGLILAGPLVRALLAMQPGVVPRADQVAIDGTLVLASVGLAGLIALVCGLGPALLGTSGGPAAFLRSRDGHGGRVRRRLHGSLVAVQVGAAFVLLYGTGTLLADMVRVTRADPGYRPEGVLTFRVSLPFGAYRGPATWEPFFASLVAELEARPGVARASASTGLPTSVAEGPEPWAPASVGETEPWGARRALHLIVTPGHFDALGIDVRSGRPLASSDGADDLPVVVVDEALADQLARDGEVVGREIDVTRHSFDDGYRIEPMRARVVGVVATVPHGHPRATPPGTIYLAHAQYPLWAMAVFVRGRDGVLPPATAVRTALASVDPRVPLVDVRPMTSVAAETLAPTRFVAALLGTLAALVVALTIAGLYGVIAESVRYRQREMGVRLALGATAATVTRRVLAGGMLLAALGVGPALLALPEAGARLRAALGFAPAVDPLALAAAVLTVAAVVAAACWLPARRAGRTDPMRVLRMD